MDDWVKAGGEEAWSRRRFLLQTAKFSALAFLGCPLALAELPVPATVPDSKSNHILLLGDWGTVAEPMQQIAVANAMKRWASDNSIRPDALFMLGDNFCGEMPDAVILIGGLNNSNRCIRHRCSLALYTLCLETTITRLSTETRLRLSLRIPGRALDGQCHDAGTA